ncbi:MAG: hypothetical protein FJZ62_04100 [Chlamydiae bacterium]|nr:hypothetical protein [Chlamydiota bacterium]
MEQSPLDKNNLQHILEWDRFYKNSPYFNKVFCQLNYYFSLQSDLSHLIFCQKEPWQKDRNFFHHLLSFLEKRTRLHTKDKNLLKTNPFKDSV